jgi:thioredoxin-like negative regulator of GroEL
MRKIQTEEEFNEVISSTKPTMVVFKTTWCKDCHYIEPFMPDVIKKYEDQLDFVQIDRDELPDVCERYNILGIPSFIAFKEGKESIRFVSKLQKSRDEIEQFVDRAVEVSSAL